MTGYAADLSGKLAPAVAALVDARRSNRPLETLPREARPTDLAQAHAVQEAVVAALGERVAGWKVAFAPDGAVMHGIILASRLREGPASIPAAEVPLLGVEVEIAFRFHHDLPSRCDAYDATEVAAACTALAGIEIVATRFTSYDGTPLLDRAADFMSNGGFITGTVREDWRDLDLTGLRATLLVNGAVAVQRTGGLASGDPVIPLLALVNALRGAGGVRAGQIVTTGSYTGLHRAAPGDVIAGVFDGFGRADVTLTA